MKAKIDPFLNEGEEISSDDIIMATMWMLECELVSDRHSIDNGADLDIDDTYIEFVYPVESKRPKITPENYFGNRSIYVRQYYKHKEQKEATLPEVLARLASTVHEAVNDVRTRPKNAIQGLLLAYDIIAGPTLVELPPLEKRRLIGTDVSGMAQGDVDFGSGRPVFVQPSLYPLLYDFVMLCPGLGYDGMIVQKIILDRQMERLKSSAVLKEVAPGVKDVLDYSISEVKEKLHVKDL